MKHPFFDGYTYNASAVVGLATSNSNKNLYDNTSGGATTNPLGSGGKLPGSRAMRIESRKGILSRKSSVNKNSFYKQKSKDTIPNKLYGGVGSAGYSSYFNKNGGPIGSAGGNFPTIKSRGSGGPGGASPNQYGQI